MKYIVTVACLIIEADDHKDAVEKTVSKLREEGTALVQVCDMDVGWREFYNVRFERNGV